MADISPLNLLSKGDLMWIKRVIQTKTVVSNYGWMILCVVHRLKSLINIYLNNLHCGKQNHDT